MKRISGFIDVVKMLQDSGISEFDIDSENFINNTSIISLIHDAYDNILLEFNYNDSTYFYKYSWMCTPYSELIASELAYDFGISFVDYDLATLDGKKGVLSKSYKKDDYNYISGKKILLDFWINSYDIEYHNNLEDIWDALEYRYRNYPNKKEIIEQLMKKITFMFIFDIITCQNDRHSLNWEIMENENMVDTVPIYDNQHIVAVTGIGSFISLTMECRMYGYLLDELKSFLKVSGDYFSNLIKESMWIISDENLESIFRRIEYKTGYPIPQNEKDYYLEKFKDHRERLETELTEYNIVKRRR